MFCIVKTECGSKKSEVNTLKFTPLKFLRIKVFKLHVFLPGYIFWAFFRQVIDVFSVVGRCKIM